MAEEYTATIRIRRPAKVRTDERGRTVWVDTIETAQLDLVSTGELKRLLDSDDEDTRSTIRQLVQGDQDGVLARDVATGLYRIISEDDIRAALDAEEMPKTSRPDEVTLEPLSDAGGEEELSLVSTQMLRKVLQTNAAAPRSGPGPRKKREAPKKDEGGGFNPYDSG